MSVHWLACHGRIRPAEPTGFRGYLCAHIRGTRSPRGVASLLSPGASFPFPFRDISSFVPFFEVLALVPGCLRRTYSESSLFISPHRLILKTCGTTLNLMGLPRILEIAREHASLPTVHRCFYSRKSFFFPELQKGPHREWKDEVEYLDRIFQNGAAYSVGKMNGNHWLLYITRPLGTPDTPTLANRPLSCAQTNGIKTHRSPDATNISPKALGVDSTIEILMTHLSPSASQAFHFPEGSDLTSTPFDKAHEISLKLGITDLFPPHLTTLDSYAFTPCGYSANALLKQGEANSLQNAEDHAVVSGGEGYYSLHVTPEEGWSYASFECNVPLSPVPAPHSDDIPDLGTLVRRVVDIFRPARLSVTLFISSAGNDEAEEEAGESAIEAAQRAFKAALTTNKSAFQDEARDVYTYTRTDKINYDFGDYDLAFASFELAT